MEDEVEQEDNKIDYSNEREQRIQEYLNVDKDEYLNRNEYEDIANEENAGEWERNKKE